MLEINKIYKGNCVDILNELPDKYIDLTITDIPFNVGWRYGEYKDNLTDDEYYLNCTSWFNAINRVSKRTIVKIPTKYSYVVLPAFAKTLGYKWTIIQYSPNTTSHGAFNLHLYTQYLVSDGEGKTPKTDFFINTKNNIETKHPAEMPTMPIKKLLNMFSDENDLILDPFMGSGTTAIACIQLKRNFIGCELNQEFIDMANNRIKKELQQLCLI